VVFISFLDFHRKKIGIIHLNDDYRNSYEKNSKEYINANFSQSTLYQIVDVEGINVETRIIEDKTYKSNTPYEQKSYVIKA